MKKPVNIYKEILKSKAGYVSKNNINSFYLILKKFNSLSMINIRKLNLNSQKCFKKNFDLQSKKGSFGNFLTKEYNKK